MIAAETDLFGVPIPAPPVVPKDNGKRKVGYAARPGTGPKKQRCGTCANFSRVIHKGAASFKCGKMAHAWTHGSETDIKPRAPACAEFERKPLAK